MSILIAGSFHEYPFPLLLEILLRRRETGLLEVSSSQETGYFYIKNGKVKDGQIGKSKGLVAVKVAGKFKDGAFRFKPLEPTDYARIVWQRSFGPTGSAIGQPPIPGLAIGSKLGHLKFDPAAAPRVLNDIASSAHRALRQFLLYTSTAYDHLEKIESSLRRRVLSCVAAGFALWRRAQVGTRVQRIVQRGLRALQDYRRRHRQPRPKFPRKASFQLPTVPRGTAITSGLQPGVEHNLIFALTVTVLWGVSGVLLYQLVSENQQWLDRAITVDEQVETPADATRTRAKPKQERRKRPSAKKSKAKSPNKKSAVPAQQDINAAPLIGPFGFSPVDRP